MNTEQLYAFRSVYINQSFSRASSELGKSQSAVTQLIQSLEKEFGTPLFIRHKRPVTPTDAGKMLLPHAEAILQEYENALALMHEQHKTSYRLIYRVNRTECMDNYIASNYRPDFPEIKELPLDSFHSTDAWEDNALYLVRGNIIQNKTIAYRKAFDSPLYAAVPAGSALAKKESIFFHDLRGKTVVLPPKAKRSPFAREIYAKTAEEPKINIIESDAGFAADIAFIRIRNVIVFCTDELITPTKNVKYVVVEDGPKTEYGFASLSPFTSDMLSLIHDFEKWYKCEYPDAE